METNRIPESVNQTNPPNRCCGVNSKAPVVEYKDIVEAVKRLDGVASRTPVLTSRTLNDRIHNEVFVKCENFQRAGAFKFRGAYNALAQLSDDEKERGVVTYSSGNHAQAMALAGLMLGVPVTVVMPEDAPPVKVQATRDYGARILFYDRRKTSREDMARHAASERELAVIPPFDDPRIVAGQGTAAHELFQQVGVLDYLLVPCGGGGLLSGCALAANGMSPGCRVIGIEPERADDATRSFRSKTLHSVHNPDTIADGARTASLGTITFPLVLEYAEDMATVSEAAIVRAMMFLLERMKILAEPTGALAFAGLLEGVVPPVEARVGVLISGGNFDLTRLPELLKLLE